MTVRPIRIPPVVVVLCCAPIFAGCAQRCTGPGCEDAWPLGRLAVLQVDPSLSDVEARADATATLAAPEDAGAGFVPAARAGLLFVGEPDAGEAVAQQIPDASGALSPELTWTGPTGFGAVVVPTAGGSLWIAAPDADHHAGGAYLFRSLAGGDATAADVAVHGVSAGDRLGAVVAICGDLSGDGLPDVAIGAPGFSGTAGAAFGADVPPLAGLVLLLRSEDLAAASGTVVPRAADVWTGAAAGDAAGSAIVCDADLDGDGADDLLWGSPLAGSDDTGAIAWVSGANLGGAPTTVVGISRNDWFGASLAAVDLDGDDRAEVVVGAPGTTGGEGSVFLYHGGDLITPSPPIEAIFSPPRGRTAGDHLGRAVRFADLDGDTVPDLLLGAPSWSENGNFDAGLLSVWWGADLPWKAVGTVTVDDGFRVHGDGPFDRVGQELGVIPAESGAASLLVPLRAQ